MVSSRSRRAGSIEAQEARGAVDASGRGFEEVELGAGAAFVQDGVDAGLGQLDVPGLACGCLRSLRRHMWTGKRNSWAGIASPGAAVAPELALGMNDAAMAFGRILAHAFAISTSDPM